MKDNSKLIGVIILIVALLFSGMYVQKNYDLFAVSVSSNNLSTTGQCVFMYGDFCVSLSMIIIAITAAIIIVMLMGKK